MNLEFIPMSYGTLRTLPTLPSESSAGVHHACKLPTPREVKMIRHLNLRSKPNESNSNYVTKYQQVSAQDRLSRSSNIIARQTPLVGSSPQDYKLQAAAGTHSNCREEYRSKKPTPINKDPSQSQMDDSLEIEEIEEFADDEEEAMDKVEGVDCQKFSNKIDESSEFLENVVDFGVSKKSMKTPGLNPQSMGSNSSVRTYKGMTWAEFSNASLSRGRPGEGRIDTILDYEALLQHSEHLTRFIESRRQMTANLVSKSTTKGSAKRMFTRIE